MEEFDKLQEGLDGGGGKQVSTGTQGTRTLPQSSGWVKVTASGFPSSPGSQTANSLWFTYIHNGKKHANPPEEVSDIHSPPEF